MPDRNTTVRGTQIRNDTVKPEDLQSVGSPSDNQIPSYNLSTGQFDWINQISGDTGLNFIIDGGGSAITTGVKGFVEIPFDCEITQVTMLADVSGSAVVDIWKDTYENHAPTDADSITASAVPTITTAIKSQDSTLTGWTKTFSAGDILVFNVDSASTITLLTIALKITRV